MDLSNSQTILQAANGPLLEELYSAYLVDNSSVSAEWAALFRQIENEEPGSIANQPQPQSGAIVGDSRIKFTASELSAITDLNLKAQLLLQTYRRQGHFAARIDPLNRLSGRYTIQLNNHGLNESDLSQSVRTHFGGRGERNLPLGELVDRLDRTYASSIGAEFFYIRDEERRRWLIERMESEENSWPLDTDLRLHIYDRLFRAEYFERFIAARFPGKKRFSIEGGESLIPSLSGLIDLAAGHGVESITLGMAHRGRLNVLHNILGKDAAKIFSEFAENLPEHHGQGDVKYHLGYSQPELPTYSGGKVRLSLAFNPSHLEVVNPVVMGSVRCRQVLRNDTTRSGTLAILMHGDAAFAGQGINYECLQMSNLDGYSIGGTFHIVINNQIGFTTWPEDSRSTPYATDLAKMLQVPIFHVNGDDPEACYRAVQLSLEFRQRFQTDVFIDLICYRRLGHNETDEPSFTQPEMYHQIKTHPTTFSLYEKRLLEEGVDLEKLEAIKKSYKAELDVAYDRAHKEDLKVSFETLGGRWKGFSARLDNESANPTTAIERTRLERLARKLTEVPDKFNLNNKVARLFEQRRNMVLSEDGQIDWGFAELLAYSTIVEDGYHIRMTGQDVKRGTFSHRHASVFDSESGKEYLPLQHISPNQAPFTIYNSLLSEEAVLGYEFGYSLASPENLVIWEAQFGDFVNTAQNVIDQSISSSETKWQRMSGLVMLLPHGYEGQGPEHSSARPERFLQLCAEENLSIVNATTPAQIFHLLRRQILRKVRKPLVIFTPKSLLRLPAAVSAISSFTDGRFEKRLDDPLFDKGSSLAGEESKVERLLLCSGKIYYDLARERSKQLEASVKIARTTAIVRIEELYPWPEAEIDETLKKYSATKEIYWVQEEPKNQGYWSHMAPWLQERSGRSITYCGRRSAASPATGYARIHAIEQEEIIKQAFA